MNVTQEYRKKNGLCLNCGEKAVQGKTRCIGCLQYEAAREKMRREEGGSDYQKAKREYLKKWQQKNPDKMAVYRGRKHDYNQRYYWNCE